MSNWPPKITGWWFIEGGDIHVEWEVDDFYENSNHPDAVLVVLGGYSTTLDGAARDCDIPVQQSIAPYPPGTVVDGFVGFLWQEAPGDQKRTVFYVQVPTVAMWRPAEGPPAPMLSVVATHPKTLHKENRITISWHSYSYNDAEILWGPQEDHRLHRKRVKPKGAVYHGKFTTNVPLAPRTRYLFVVRVKNSLTTNRWVETSIGVTSTHNCSSVVEFLQLSGIGLPAELGAEIGRGYSMRETMGV